MTSRRGGTGPYHCPTSAPAPAQLPPPIADFTGREEHIELFRNLLTDAGSPPQAIAITGIGGVGKTTLALQTAFQLRASFPGGRLFASMAGTTDRPAVPADVQRRFLKSLGTKAEALPTDNSELTAHYRSALSDLRLLIVLDDVRDAQQARDLLPTGPGSAAIVTSRASLTGLEGATAVALTGLTPAESRELLGRLAGSARITGDAEAADAVVRSCSGLPLAVRISGARLAARPGWQIRDLADRLADERGRLDQLAVGDLDVRASFQIGFEQVDDSPGPDPGLRRTAGSGDAALPASAALCLLGLWQGSDISVPAAAALFATGQPEAERLLEHLVDLHLLESPMAARYRLHDLIRLFAAEKSQSVLGDEARRTAVGRLVAWYAYAVDAADAAVAPHRRRVPPDSPAPDPPSLLLASQAEALAWSELEHTNIVAAILQATAIREHRYAWRIAVSSWSVLAVHRDWGPLLAGHRLGLAAARAAADPLAEAWILNGLGCVLLEQGKLDQAEEMMRRSLALREAEDDLAGQALTLNNLGVLESRRGDTVAMVATLERSLAVHRRTADLPGQAMTLSNLGQVAHLTGDGEKALAYLAEALDLRRRLGDPRAIGMTVHGLGVEYLRTGRLRDAAAHFAEALELSRQAGDQHTEAQSHLDLGRTLILESRAADARPHLVEAHRILESLGDPRADEAKVLLQDIGD